MNRPAHQLPARSPDPGFFGEIKLMLAALGAGNNAVPLGDNSQTARRLAEYAAALRGAP